MFKNNVIIAGNLVEDAKIFTTNATMQDGTPFQIVEGTLAINRMGSNAGADFVNFKLAGYQAKRLLDANKHLKGTPLGVSGVLVQEKFQDQHNNTQYRIKVLGDDLMFGDKFYANFNQVTLYGNLSSEPESKPGKDGKNYTRTNVGVNLWDKSKKEQVASFFDVISFDKKADFMKNYFYKGDAIFLQGRLHTSAYTQTLPDGSTVKRYSTQILADSFTFAQRKGKASAHEKAPATNPVQEVAGVQQEQPTTQQPTPTPAYGYGVQNANPQEPSFANPLLVEEELPF